MATWTYNIINVLDFQGSAYKLCSTAQRCSEIKFSTISCAQHFIGNLNLQEADIQKLQKHSDLPLLVNNQSLKGVFRLTNEPRLQSTKPLATMLERQYYRQHLLAKALFQGRIHAYSENQMAIDAVSYSTTGRIKLVQGYRGQQAPAHCKSFTDHHKAIRGVQQLNLSDIQKQQILQAFTSPIHGSSNDEKLASMIMAKELWIIEKPHIATQSYAASPRAPKVRAKSSAQPQASTTSGRITSLAKDLQSQIETLKKAAASGVPFCEECVTNKAA